MSIRDVGKGFHRPRHTHTLSDKSCAGQASHPPPGVEALSLGSPLLCRPEACNQGQATQHDCIAAWKLQLRPASLWRRPKAQRAQGDRQRGPRPAAC